MSVAGCTTTAPVHTRAEREKMLMGVLPYIRKLVLEATENSRESGMMNDEDVEDIEQIISIAVWKGLERYDPSRSRVVTFAGKIARSEIASYFRSRGRGLEFARIDNEELHADPLTLGDRDDGDSVPDGADPVAQEVEMFDATAIGGLVADFSESQRKLFKMMAVEGLSFERVAERLGQKLSIVENNVKHLVRKLVESGRLAPELLERFEKWKAVDAVNPVKQSAHRKTTYKAIKVARERNALERGEPGAVRKVKVLARIQTNPEKVYAAVDFLDLGERKEVGASLRSLVYDGKVASAGKGFYVAVGQAGAVGAVDPVPVPVDATEAKTAA